MLRRLAFGFGANAIGQAISIVIQVFSLPLFLSLWDASTYGTWLLISALPGYLGMADVGIVSVAGNTMTIALGRGDLPTAQRVYQSAQLFLAVVVGGLALVLVPAVLLWPMPRDVTLDMRLALEALIAGVLVSLYGGLADNLFKATERYPLGTLLGQMVRLAEWFGFMAGLLLFRSFAGVALMGLAARLIATAAMIGIGQRSAHGLRLGFAEADRDELRSMLRPAVSFMAFPLANALSFQGVTLVVGAAAGPTAVALFNAYRTLARVAVQLTSMVSLALWPEFARLYGKGGLAAVQPLFRRAAWGGGGLAILFSPALFVVSPWLLARWTHGRIPFEPTLMGLLLAYAALAGLWHVPRVFLMSTNQHIGLSGWSLLTSALCAALAWGLVPTWGVNGAGVAMLVSEACIAGICIVLACRRFAPPPAWTRTRPSLALASEPFDETVA